MDVLQHIITAYYYARVCSIKTWRCKKNFSIDSFVMARTIDMDISMARTVSVRAGARSGFKGVREGRSAGGEGGCAPAQSGTLDRAAPPSATAKPTTCIASCNITQTRFILALRN